MHWTARAHTSRRGSAVWVRRSAHPLPNDFGAHARRRKRIAAPDLARRISLSTASAQPGGSERRTSLLPAATPRATLSPKAIAVPAPTSGSIQTIGAAMSAAPNPATIGASGLLAASTYRSRRATKSFACVNPMITAAVDSANASNPNTCAPPRDVATG